MDAQTTEKILDDILRREGSTFTDDPADRGGATKYGITQKAWTEYIAGRGVSMFIPGPGGGSLVDLDSSVKYINERHARQFYIDKYLEPFDWIKDDRLRILAIDSGVNHGSSRAIKWLQKATGMLRDDGVAGPFTQKAVNAGDAVALYNEVLRTRFRFYAQIATDQLPADPDAKFLRGWINRACEFLVP